VCPDQVVQVRLAMWHNEDEERAPDLVQRLSGSTAGSKELFAPNREQPNHSRLGGSLVRRLTRALGTLCYAPDWGTPWSGLSTFGVRRLSPDRRARAVGSILWQYVVAGLRDVRMTSLEKHEAQLVWSCTDG
jgi:hypothetical protein